MDKLKKALDRLKRQYDAYEKERNGDDEDVIDISLACDLADSIPYLIETINQKRNLIREIEGSLGWHIDAVERYEKALEEIVNHSDVSFRGEIAKKALQD